MVTEAWPSDLPSRLDHTLLRPDATGPDMLRHCEEARRYGFAVVFIHPCFLEEAAAAVAGSSVRLCVPIGFPFGAQRTTTKVQEAMEAFARGARELDMKRDRRQKEGRLSPQDVSVGTSRKGKGLTRFIGTRDNAARQRNRIDDVAEQHV